MCVRVDVGRGVSREFLKPMTNDKSDCLVMYLETHGGSTELGDEKSFSDLNCKHLV